MPNRHAFIQAFGFAALSALGNALVALGQTKAGKSDNPFSFLSAALIVCLSVYVLVGSFISEQSVYSGMRANWKWAFCTGAGFFLTFIGFYFLYTRFGPAYYTLYAVLSIVTTSVIVAALFGNERLNLYSGVGILLAVGTIVAFGLARHAR